ncbi:hypothetical protein GCM10012275_63840 [Longimycelium tulufanense]|uniref:Uncharacterized protein n=1 Tax=Longimycelium tulufanense TaxID=907463 RepID=A0A8J3CLQ4_9PSEU|nr:hypothetical protein GCM10012275_63840 [Longimycelium tulufanense]
MWLTRWMRRHRTMRTEIAREDTLETWTVWECGRRKVVVAPKSGHWPPVMMSPLDAGRFRAAVRDAILEMERRADDGHPGPAHHGAVPGVMAQ